MDIEEFTADRAATVEEVVALRNAVREADSPWLHPETPATLVGTMRHGWDGETPRSFVARVGGRLVAEAQLWAGEWDNIDQVWLDLGVHPEHRRRGVGSAVLDRLLEESRALGRTTVGMDSWDSAAAIGFATSHGFEQKSSDLQRRQVLPEVDRGVVEKLYADAREAAAAYDLVRLLGRTPEDLLDRVAEMTAAINDAPTDDLDIEDEVFPPERIRAYEEACLAKELRLYRLVARHRDSGELAGQTVVAVEAERPWIGEQHDTSVVRSHRGHRLGLLLKAGMIQWLDETEPALRTVDTWNAESNERMIAVNEQLGYRVTGRALAFQRPL